MQSPSQEAGKKEPLPLAPAKAFDGGETGGAGRVSMLLCEEASQD